MIILNQDDQYYRFAPIVIIATLLIPNPTGRGITSRALMFTSPLGHKYPDPRPYDKFHMIYLYMRPMFSKVRTYHVQIYLYRCQSDHDSTSYRRIGWRRSFCGVNYVAVDLQQPAVFMLGAPDVKCVTRGHVVTPDTQHLYLPYLSCRCDNYRYS